MKAYYKNMDKVLRVIAIDDTDRINTTEAHVEEARQTVIDHLHENNEVFNKPLLILIDGGLT